MKPRLLLRALGLALAFAAAPAIAQSRHDSNAPIDFNARNIQLDDRASRAVLTGNVVITQAEMTLRADRVTVTYTGSAVSGSPQATRLDAAGGVTVTRPDQSARAQYALYDVDRRVITMVNGVTLRQAGNIVSGNRLTINLDTGRATMDGSGVAESGDSGQPDMRNSGGRVTGRFSVPKRDSAAAPRQ